MKENALDYIDTVMNAQLTEFDKQMKAIKCGIGMVFLPFMMKIYTWKDLEYKVCLNHIAYRYAQRDTKLVLAARTTDDLLKG